MSGRMSTMLAVALALLCDVHYAVAHRPAPKSPPTFNDFLAAAAPLRHPALDVKQMKPVSAEQLAQIREFLAQAEKQDDNRGPLVQTWRQTLADPLYPAKVEAARKVAAARFSSRLPRIYSGELLEFLAAREQAKERFARWILKEKFAITLPPSLPGEPPPLTCRLPTIYRCDQGLRPEEAKLPSLVFTDH